MGERVLLIDPPLSAPHSQKFLNHQVPLGFLYMADLLEKNGFEVKILDCPLYYKKTRRINDEYKKIGMYPEEIEQSIRGFKPSLVGITVSYTMFEADAFEVIDLVKKVDKNIVVAVGGAHCSASPEFVLRNKNIDIVVTGEGELSFLEIAQRIRDKKPLTKIKGSATKINEKFLQNVPREQIMDLDSIEPAWHLINFQDYYDHPDNASISMRAPSISMVTSRGCPLKCVFCSVHTVWGRNWRSVSPKKVVDQMEMLVKKYGVKHIRVNDDNLTLRKEHIMEVCDEIIKRKLNIKWDTPSGVAFWTLDEEVLDKMKESGYYRITFAIESGSGITHKYIQKRVDLEKINQLIDYCHKIGLWTASFFIIGFPYERPQDLKETVNFIVNSKLNFPFIFLAQPYIGTSLYEDFKKEGLLEGGFVDASTFINTRYRTKYFTSEQLNKIRRNTYLKFYMRKMQRYSNPATFYREFLSKLKTKEDMKYAAKVIKNVVADFWY